MRAHARSLLFLLLLIGATRTAFADTCTWIATETGDWEEADHWNCGGISRVPNPDDTAVIGEAPTSNRHVIIKSAVRVAQLTLNGNRRLVVTGSLGIDGDMTWICCEIDNGNEPDAPNAVVEIGGDLSLTGSGSSDLERVDMLVLGSTSLGKADEGAFNIGANASFTSTGSFSIESDTHVGGFGTFVNNGTLVKTPGVERFTVDPVLNSTGAIEVEGGTLALQSGGSLAGSLYAAENAAFEFGNRSGGGLGNSAVTSLRASLGGSGTFLLVRGTLDVAEEVTVPVGATFIHDAGTLITSAPLRIAGGMEWDEGTVSGLNPVSIEQSGKLTISGSGRKTLDGAALRNHGHADLHPTFGIEFANDALFLNAGSAHIHQSFVFKGRGRVENEGNLTLQDASLIFGFFVDAFETPFNNSGTVRGNGWIDLVKSTFTNDGTFAPERTSSGALLPGTISLNGTYPNGRLEIDVESHAGPGVGHDQLQVGTTALLGGALAVDVTKLAEPGDFVILTCSGPRPCVVGTFASVSITGSGDYDVEYNENNVTLVIRAPAAAGIVVNTTDDDTDLDAGNGVCDTGGPPVGGQPHCTLRAAIMEANASEGAGKIHFDIPEEEAVAGVYTIHPGSPLPIITEPVVLDAATQPGHDGVPIIQLAGDSHLNGLHITGGGATIRGLIVNGFAGSGILLEGSGGNVVENCFIGTEAAGLESRGNDAGVTIRESTSNSIGGPGSGQRNLISGNVSTGIVVSGAGSVDNTIENNYIGTNYGAQIAVSNGGDGIRISEAEGSRIVGNVISGNEGVGISIEGALETMVTMNSVGVEISRLDALLNSEGAIHVTDGASGVRIGGLDPAVSNTVYGGITVDGDVTQKVLVQGNIMNVPAAWTSGADLRLPLRLDAGGPACNGWVDAKGPNDGMAAPRILHLAPGLVEGMTRPGSTVEVYRVSAAGVGRGRFFARKVHPLGHGVADDEGYFRVAAGITEGDMIAATATDPEGNSSELSQLKRHVIVAPGIGGSWLEAPDGSNLWIPTAPTDPQTNDLLVRLSMNADGSNRGGVKAEGVIELVPPGGVTFSGVELYRNSIYGDLIRWLEGDRFPGENTTWLDSFGRTTATDVSDVELWRFANDWRLDQRALAEHLRRRIDWLTSDDSPVARSCEVDLVSHSNGGVITSTYVRAHPEHSRDRVHRVVEIAVPYLGAWQAAAAHTKGYLFGLEHSLLGFDPEWGRMIEMTRNLTGAYTLLPSRAYWDVSSQFEVGSHALMEDLHGNPVESFGAMRAFMARPKLQGGLGRNGPLWDAVSARVHDEIDDWRGWSGPPHIFRMYGTKRLSGVRGPTTAVGWVLDPVAAVRAATDEGFFGGTEVELDWRIEPGDTPLHAMYRTSQIPIIGLGDGTVPLSSATLGRDPRAGRVDHSGVIQPDGSPNVWIEDFVEYPCDHLEIVAEHCADAAGRTVLVHAEDILNSGHVVPAATGNRASLAGQAAADGDYHVLYLSGTNRIGVHVKDAAGGHTGPSDDASFRDIEYGVPNIGYWPNEYGAVVALPGIGTYVVSARAPESSTAIRVVWTIGSETGGHRQLLFADQAIDVGGYVQAEIAPATSEATASLRADADGDGQAEQTLEPAASIDTPGTSPDVPSPKPLVIDRSAFVGSTDEPTASVTLSSSGPAWTWRATTSAGWLSPAEATGSTPDSLVFRFASSELEAGTYLDSVTVRIGYDAYEIAYVIPVRLVVRSEAAAVAEIVVEPRHVALSPGTSQPFVATALDAFGVSVQAILTWSANGGTITSEGVFTAGNQIGEYVVTAGDPTSGVEGTASVTILDPVSSEDGGAPDTFALYQNYPNPFNPSTVIAYDVREPSHVSLRVYDALGRFVQTLVDAPKAPGRYLVHFDTSSLPSGIYFYSVQMSDFRAVRTMLLVR